MKESFEEFLKKSKNVSGNRTHKITGSQNTISGFSYYRKIRPKESQFVLKDREYLSIIREMNNLVADSLIKNKSIRLPSGFGKLEIVKIEPISWIDSDGKFKTNRVVDMHSTFKLWYGDDEARENKTIVRYDDDFIFRIKYTTRGRMYKYNKYFSIQFNRELRKKLTLAIRAGNYDTYLKIPYKQWVKQNEPISK